MDIRPIRDEAEYRLILQSIADLMNIPEADLGEGDGDRLGLYVLLVEDYERRVHPIESPDPVAAIEHAMEQRGLSRADLEPVLGGRGRVSEILNRRRALSIAHIRGLVRLLGLPAEVLIQPYALASREVA